MITENDQENLLFVEYDVHGQPFNVITAGESNTHRLFWNFEWSRRFGYSLYEMTGCGGARSVSLGQMVKIPKKKMRFWARRDMIVTASICMGKKWRRGKWSNDNYREVILELEDWERMGYRKLDKPLVDDPFADACEGDAVYCRTCNDWLPNESWNFCQHLAWCERCEEVVHVLPSGHIGWDTYRQPRKRHALEVS